jgi:phosphoribosylglycinamide formyltransferase-1
VWRWDVCLKEQETLILSSVGSKPHIAIFISGRGSNMVSLIEAMQAGNVDAVPSLVISNNREAEGLSRAAALGIPCEIVCRDQFNDQVAFETRSIELLKKYQIDWVALAGYMAILGPIVLDRYSGRIINIHPSLLPSFKGLNPQQQALTAGVKYTGCTVHYVNSVVDGGAIIEQAVVEVNASDTLEVLSDRILRVEHTLYPRALQRVVNGQ